MFVKFQRRIANEILQSFTTISKQFKTTSFSIFDNATNVFIEIIVFDKNKKKQYHENANDRQKNNHFFFLQNRRCYIKKF